MLTHYKDLLRQFWTTILAAALGAGVLTCALSLVLLEAMPRYTSAVTLNMQPSEEALRFNNAFLGVSQINPATIITQAHIERLLSREVAERTIDILEQEGAGRPGPETPGPFDRLKAFLWRNWAMLNYGYFVPADPRDQAIEDLRQAIDVRAIAGSYILRLEVTDDDPDLAARAANALARAYVEVATEEAATEAAAVDAALATLQAEKEAELSGLMDQRRTLDRAVGFESLDEGRAILLAGRNEARQDVAAAESRVRMLREQLDAGSAPDASPDATLRSRLHEAEALAARRREALAAAEERLRALDGTESRLAEIDQSIRDAEGDLGELQRQRIATELARKARLNPVRTINAAVAPVYPAFPKVLFNTVIGTMLGAVLAIAPIAVLDVLDDRIRTTEDLRQALGSRGLPSVTRRLVGQARRFLRTGRRPGKQLQEYAEAMGRRFLTDGLPGWPDRPVHVTAFGTADDVARLHVVAQAAVRLMAPRDGRGSAASKVVALPPLAYLSDWSACRDGSILIGVTTGRVARAEVERTVAAASEPNAAPFFTVLM